MRHAALTLALLLAPLGLARGRTVVSLDWGWRIAPADPARYNGSALPPLLPAPAEAAADFPDAGWDDRGHAARRVH